MQEHRKKVQHRHEPGDFHELTFSCYLRQPLLIRDDWRTLFCRSLERAIDNHGYQLIAFVLMPEHVHLLVLPPAVLEPDIEGLLYAIKRPYSWRVEQILAAEANPLLEQLTILERPGKRVFRYWQEGPGYDRNLSGETAVMNSISYLHENPVRRGLVSRGIDWKWSSARWYQSETQEIDPDLPRIQGLP